MNERIQKLWAQAAFELNQEFFFFPDNWDELLREKFAELIVRECRLAVNRIDVESPEASIALTMADAAIRDCLGVK